jgi:hypothetical protein
MRETGRSVEGHVEATNPDEALKALSDNAIVTETLNPDPKPLNLTEELPDAPELANALDSAFDASSTQVAFDDLTDRYKGKKVWVIDRDKIRRRVCQVVDQAMAHSAATGESAMASRQRVQAAIQGMFADNRNIASERPAESLPGYRPPQAAAPPPVALPPAPTYTMPAPTVVATGLEAAINRLVQVVAQAEKVMATMAIAARNMGRGGGGGGGGGGGRRRIRSVMERAQNDVLLEIFKANLELAKAVTGVPGANGAPAEGAAPPGSEAAPLGEPVLVGGPVEVGAAEASAGAEAHAGELSGGGDDFAAPAPEMSGGGEDIDPEPAGAGASDSAEESTPS